MRLTLGTFKQSANWPQTINIDSSDPQFLLWLNELLSRLLNAGIYVGSTQRYQICSRSGCLTWPRQFATIEAMDSCDRPVPLRNHWFEFLENGPGRFRSGTGCQTFNAVDRGSGFVMFDDLTVASRIRLYTQFNSDTGKTVTIRGFDNNGQEVLANSGVITGEKMVLNGTYVDSATIWGPQVFRQVLKDATNGYVRAYSYDASLPPPPAAPGSSDTPLKPMAAWEPSETFPDYRRTFMPAIQGMNGGCCNGLVPPNPPGTCTTPTTLTVLAKIAHIPVSNDLDFLWTGNLGALKLGMISLMREERGDSAGANLAMNGVWNPVFKRFENGAIPLLEQELDSFQGAGTIVPVRLEPQYLGGAGILNMI